MKLILKIFEEKVLFCIRLKFVVLEWFTVKLDVLHYVLCFTSGQYLWSRLASYGRHNHHGNPRRHNHNHPSPRTGNARCSLCYHGNNRRLRWTGKHLLKFCVDCLKISLCWFFVQRTCDFIFILQRSVLLKTRCFYFKILQTRQTTTPQLSFSGSFLTWLLDIQPFMVHNQFSAGPPRWHQMWPLIDLWPNTKAVVWFVYNVSVSLRWPSWRPTWPRSKRWRRQATAKNRMTFILSHYWPPPTALTLLCRLVDRHHRRE